MSAARCMLACVLAGLAGPASAQTLVNFDNFPSSDQLDGVPPPNTVLTDDLRSEGVLFGRQGFSVGVAVVGSLNSFAPSSAPNSVVGLDANGRIVNAASADIYFSFVAPGTNTPAEFTAVSFTLGDAGGDLDTFVIHSYDIAGNQIDVRNVGQASRFTVDLSGVGAIHRVWVEFTADPAGYSLDDLRFTVPAPGASALAGLGLLLGARRRR